MYCKNCGNAVDPKAAICVNCGVPVGQGDMYCANCGNQLQPGAAVCMSCGSATGNASVGGYVSPNAKSKIAAGLLGIFLGSLGIHNFYLGYKTKALIQLLMSVLSCGALAAVSQVWGLVEGIMILTGSIPTDADGNPLKD